MSMVPRTGGAGGLRRELSSLHAYATLLGILIGAGIFKVTGDAFALTGPSVILAHLLMVPCVLATSVAYAAFASTPLGEGSGGEYTHLTAVFGDARIAFVGAWLKLVAFTGALAYLAAALADYLLDMLAALGVAPAGSGAALSGASAAAAGAGAAPGSGAASGAGAALGVACGTLLFFFAVHALGVRWFGRLQVAMCALLGVSLAVLIVPGFFALHAANYSPFLTHGVKGLLGSMVPLFFAWCGFEALAHTGAETRGSSARLPRIFLRGIAITAVIYVAMSVVAFGVLPGERLAASTAPMADVARTYLPVGASALVSLGALMALATSLNATMFVPSRLALVLAADGLLPRWCAAVHPRTGTPLNSLLLTLLGAVALLLTGQVALALNMTVLALLVLYLLHSLALLLLPSRRPDLERSVTPALPRRLRTAAALLSLASIGTLIAVQLLADLHALADTTLAARLTGSSLTAVELLLAWGLLGALVLAGRRRKAAGRAQPEAEP